MGDPRTALDRVCRPDEPVISVIVPCFNQALRISHVLEMLGACIASNFELIAIDDASTDQTLEALMAVEASLQQLPNLTRFRVLRTDSALFETGCDVLGFSLAEAPYILEVQADMHVNDPGFDLRMIAALKQYPDVLMVSGRGTQGLLGPAEDYMNSLGAVVAHNHTLAAYAFARVRSRIAYRLRQVAIAVRREPPSHQARQPTSNRSITERVFPPSDRFARTGEAGRLGALIDVPLEPVALPTDRLWLGHTVMRGPLMIDRGRLEEVGGLDGVRFFLGYDDHDLSYRAFRDCGLRCGYLPVAFESPLGAGSTRKPRSIRTEADIFRRLWGIRQVRKESGLFEAAKAEQSNLPVPEIRSLG